MAKPKKKHKGKVHTPSEKTPAKPKKFALPSSLIKNILILVGVVLLLNGLKTYNNGYRWVADILVVKSQENLEKYKRLTYQQKMEAKLGFTMRYFDFIVKNTPEDAVILMPPDTIIRPPEQLHSTKTKMNGYTTNRKWVSYFLYPRKLVYESHKEDFPGLYDSITHVAIISNWGYKKLPYRVAKENEYSVLPLKLPK